MSHLPMIWVSDRTMGDHTGSSSRLRLQEGVCLWAADVAAVIWRIREEGRALAGGSAGEQWGDITHERRGGGGGHANPPPRHLCQLTHNTTAEKRGSVGGTDGKRQGIDATVALARACRLGGQAIRWTHTAEGLNEVHCCLRKLICL